MNILLTIIVLGAGATLAWYLLTRKKADTESGDFDYEDAEDAHTLDNITRQIKERLSAQLRVNLQEENLSLRQLESRKRDKQKLETALGAAPSGELRARKEIKGRIRMILNNKEIGYGFNEHDLNRLVPFNDARRLSCREIHEILLYLYNKAYGADGLSKMFDEFNLVRGVEGSDGRKYYKITKRMITDVLEQVAKGKSSLTDYKLSYNDKLEIITQLIYSRYLGFGAIDSLYFMAVDEIDCGISGIPIGGFNIAVAKQAGTEIRYGYESIWIVYHGDNVHLEYLAFDNENEFERVASNVYRYNATKVLSQAEGMIVSTMPDGSRIAVTRPPAAESWAFFLRKFSASTKPPRLANLIRARNPWIPLALLKWCIRAEQSMVVTGQTGTGKSTILKGIMRFIDPRLNIRILEMTLELSIRYMYPDLNVLTMQQTGTNTTDTESDFLKKANVAVTIMGEIAEPPQAVQFVKTCQVNSRFGLATHHANTAENLVDALAGNFTELGLYKDKNDAVSMVARTVNIDCHLAFNGGERHIDGITEIIPYDNVDFPSQSPEFADKSLEDKYHADSLKYFRDSINPKKFITRNMCRWSDIGDTGSYRIHGHFELSPEFAEKGFSDRFKECVKTKLKESEQQAFAKDEEMILKAWRELTEWNSTHTDNSEPEYSKEVSEWISEICSI